MLTMISTDISRKRRDLYRRAMTLSSIPPQLIPEVDNETDEDEESRLLKSPRHLGGHTRDGQKSGANTLAEGGSPAKNGGDKDDDPDEASAKSKRMMFQQRRSITISTDEPLLPLKDINSGRKSPFSKSPTSPSAILAKFKDRIQQSLFLSSTEWPSAAAILQDRRQKANEHAKAALQKNLDKESIQMTEWSKRRKRCKRSDTIGHAADENVLENDGKFGRCRMKSDPVVHLSESKRTSDIEDDTLPPEIELKNTNAARDAFRRRSISEDTYDRLPPTFIKERKETIASAQTGDSCMENELTSSNSGGVVCSNEDLQNILTCYKKDITPAAGPSRPVSVEINKPPRQSYCSQSSYTSQSSRTSYVSQTSVASVKSIKPDNAEIATCDKRYISKLDSSGGGGGGGTYIYSEAMQDIQGNRDTEGSEGNDKDCDEDKHRKDSINIIDTEKQDVKQQPPEIIFDELGQTWDVYGAEFDPEILGGAIQKHLEKLMSKGERTPKLSDSSGSPSNGESLHETHITEPGSSNSLVAWWRFLCLFGTHRKQAEPTMC